MNDTPQTAPETRTDRILQFAKYCLVGVLNTLVTFGVIFLCKSLLGMNMYVSNALGYIAGLINSFLCNRQWVFKSEGKVYREAIRFAVGFALCYGLQFALVVILSESAFGSIIFRVPVVGVIISGYGIATILGNIVYTLANFVYNRFVTFKEKE